MEQEFEYFAFISYSWDDKKTARWLQRKLESYRLPSIVRKQLPDVPRKLRIFRDATDLRPSTSLKQILREELENSRYLIVVCSPNSAQSDWVGLEIEEFISMGKKEQIIMFIINGIPYSNDAATECYHPVIKKHFAEVLGANIHEQGDEYQFIKREKAVVKVIARMLAVSFDTLWGRYRRHFIQKVLLYTLVLTGFISSIGWVWCNYRPFDLHIALTEVTYPNKDLPPEKGIIQLILSNDTLNKTILNSSEWVVFKNIPGKYRNEQVRALIQLKGYLETDTLVRLKESVALNIARDSTWAILAGIVYNDNLVPLEGIQVKMHNGLSAVTDQNGAFNIRIPLILQRQYADVSFSREGYFDRLFEHALISRNWKVVLIKKTI